MVTISKPHLQSFWQTPLNELFHSLETSAEGLTNDEASLRLQRYGPNLPSPQKTSEGIALFFAQFKSPIILILLFAVGLSIFLQNVTDSLIILTIILVSCVLGFWQEHRASNAVKKLLTVVQITTTVIRDGSQKEIGRASCRERV